ncbi:hypothetical protein, partial [uncultured Hymenobacter sp.]|uniref:hypothetical protein n=1 Tax=uncultured Hymenobacter sp. TaxID=170016 RepID=UPI0035C9F092
MKKPKLLRNIGITICTIGGVITIGTLGLGAKLGLPIAAAGFSFILAGRVLNKYGRPTLTTHLIIAFTLSLSYILLVLNYTKSTVIRVKDVSRAQEGGGLTGGDCIFRAWYSLN